MSEEMKPRRCRTCNSPRKDDICWKCGDKTFVPAKEWDEPALPAVGPIRAAAKEKGYAIGVHGSQERDLDLIAAPWTDNAASPEDLLAHIASKIGGRVVDGEKKPGRAYAANIQMDGWYRMIDISICHRTPSPGYVMVPEEISGAMEDAYYEAHAASEFILADAQETWAAMLTAARAGEK